MPNNQVSAMGNFADCPSVSNTVVLKGVGGICLSIGRFRRTRKLGPSGSYGKASNCETV